MRANRERGGRGGSYLKVLLLQVLHEVRQVRQQHHHVRERVVGRQVGLGLLPRDAVGVDEGAAQAPLRAQLGLRLGVA